MTAPSATALAALLASRPEECAAVVATLAMAGGDGIDWTRIHRLIVANEPALVGLNVEGVLEALKVADLLWIDEPLVGMCLEHRYAIARMGAAVWLRARVGAPVTAEQRERAMLVRLHELAAVEARDGHHFEWRIHADQLTREDYRALIAHVCRQQELDVEAEVAAVWGTAPAPAPKETSK